MQARGGKYTQIPDTLSDDMHSDGVEVRRLAGRVLDAEVRAAVDAFEDRSARLSTSPRHLQGFVGDDLDNRATSDIMEPHEGYETLMAVLGEAVRREIAWRTAVEDRLGRCSYALSGSSGSIIWKPPGGAYPEYAVILSRSRRVKISV